MLLARRSFLTVLLAAPLLGGTLGRARAVGTGANAVPQGLALVMFEQDGCPWCAKWNNDVAPGYAQSDEGRAAPLVRRDIHDPIPPGMTLASPPQFTPTFVLIKDGRELGRIQGYPGSDFFWAMLDELLAKAGTNPAETPKT